MSDRDALKQEIGYWRDVETDPTATTGDRQHARRKVRTLRAQLARTPDTSRRDTIMTKDDLPALSVAVTGTKQERIAYLRQHIKTLEKEITNANRELGRLLKTAA